MLLRTENLRCGPCPLGVPSYGSFSHSANIHSATALYQRHARKTPGDPKQTVSVLMALQTLIPVGQADITYIVAEVHV